jgi:hypothetical protein
MQDHMCHVAGVVCCSVGSTPLELEVIAEGVHNEAVGGRGGLNLCACSDSMTASKEVMYIPLEPACSTGVQAVTRYNVQEVLLAWIGILAML